MIQRIHRTGFTDWGEALIASAVVHIIAGALIFDLIGDLNINFALEDPEPSITVTSIVLGTDAVTASTDQGEGETALTEDGPDELTPAAPVTPETIEPIEPEAEPATTNPETSDPIAPDAIDPVGPNDTSAAVEPSILRPTDTATSLSGANVSGTGASPVIPDRVGAIERVPVIDTTPGSVLPPNPGTGSQEAGGELNEIARRIRAQLNDPCLLAIPQQRVDGSSELLMLGDTDTAMRGFADIVLEGLDPRPGQRSILVDNRQCGALNYVRQSEAYPAFRLTLTLDTQTLESGSNLTGTIGNVGGRYVTLVLVDDNGVVQDLGEYLSFRGGFAQFDVPLSRAGVARDTSQLLVAFGSAARPRAVDSQNGQLANVYFRELRAELGANTPMVVVPFELR